MTTILSTTDVARHLQVAVGSVINWIDQDLLEAGRTPGGHRRVAVDHLVDFMHRQNLPVPPELAPSGTKILIVDDDPPVAEWLAEEIKAEHPTYEVRTAYDGFSAGQLVGTWRPDAVLLDLRMPGIDGYEVCRRIKAAEETKHAAVIAITAYHSPEAEERILECGARACLAKPLDRDVLLQELREALSRPARVS